MRLGFIAERKIDRPIWHVQPRDRVSEALDGWEEDEIVSGLRDAGHEVLRIATLEELVERIERVRSWSEIVLNRSVGFGGVAGKVETARVLEEAGIPYIGSPPAALRRTRDKLAAKRSVASVEVRTPPAALWTGGSPGELSTIPYPAIVKPIGESSSVGIDAGSVVRSPAEAARRARWVVESYGQAALVETFVPGIDLEVPVLVENGPRALGCAVAASLLGSNDPDVILTSGEIGQNQFHYVDPPEWVDVPTVREIAERAAAALGIRDYGRIDFRVGRDGTPWFIEASTHPYLQSNSSFQFLAKKRGLLYPDMLDEIVQVGARRYQN